MLNDQTIEEFKREIDAERKGYKKKYSSFIKPFRRCCDLIWEGENYDFLSSIGYEDTDKEQFDFAARLVYDCFRITFTLFVPFQEILKEELRSNPLAFYQESVVLGAKILSVEEFFKVILSYGTDERHRILDRMAKDSRSLRLLYDAVDKGDIDLFRTTIEQFDIDITLIGQYLGFVQILLTACSSNTSDADIMDMASSLYRLSRGEFSFLPPGRSQDFRGNVTRKNCVKRFIAYHQAAVYTFLQTFSFFTPIINGSLNVSPSPVFRKIGIIVCNSEEYKLGAKRFAGIGKASQWCTEPEEQQGPAQIDDSDDIPAASKEKELRPLRRPSIFRGQIGTQKAERVYQTLVNEGYLFTEKNNFLYMFGITAKEPEAGARRIVWKEKKYKLQVFLYLLYPGRRSKGEEHSPKKSECDAVFCKENGDSLNLSNTPLQLEKRASSKKDEYRRQSEENAINFFKQILGD